MNANVLNLRELMDSLVFGVSHVRGTDVTAIPIFMANYLFEVFIMFVSVYILTETLYLSFTYFSRGGKEAMTHLSKMALAIGFVLFIMSLRDPNVTYRGTSGYAIISWYSKIFKSGEDIADALTKQVLYSTGGIAVHNKNFVPTSATPLAGVAASSFLTSTKDMTKGLYLSPSKIAEFRKTIQKQKDIMVKGEIALYQLPDIDPLLFNAYKIAKGFALKYTLYGQGYSFDDKVEQGGASYSSVYKVTTKYKILNKIGLYSKTNTTKNLIFNDKFNIKDIITLNNWSVFGLSKLNANNVCSFDNHKFGLKDYIYYKLPIDSIDGYLFFLNDILKKLDDFNKIYGNNLDSNSKNEEIKKFGLQFNFLKQMVSDLKIIQQNIQNFTTTKLKDISNEPHGIELENLNNLVITNNKKIQKLIQFNNKNISLSEYKNYLIPELNKIVLNYEKINLEVSKDINLRLHWIIKYSLGTTTHTLYDTALKRAAVYDLSFINSAILIGNNHIMKSSLDPTYNLLKDLNQEIQAKYKNYLELKKANMGYVYNNFQTVNAQQSTKSLDSLVKTIYQYDPMYAKRKPNNDKGFDLFYENCNKNNGRIVQEVTDDNIKLRCLYDGKNHVLKETLKINPDAFYKERQISWVDLGYYFAAIKSYMSNYVVFSQYYLATEDYMLTTNKISEAELNANIKLISDAMKFNQQYSDNNVAQHISKDIALFQTANVMISGGLKAMVGFLSNMSLMGGAVAILKLALSAGMAAVTFLLVFLLVNLIVKGILIIVPAIFWFIAVLNWYLSVSIMIILIPVGLYSLLLGGSENAIRQITKKTIMLMLTPTMLVILFFIAIMFSIEIGVVIDYFVPFLSHDAIIEALHGINDSLFKELDNNSDITEWIGSKVDDTISYSLVKGIVLEAVFFAKLVIILFFNIKLYMLFSKATEYINEITEVGQYNKPIDAIGDASGLMQKFKMNV